MRAGIALYLAVGLASADRLLEATVREAAMSSPEWWEAHHQLAKLQPGTSWFGPIGRAIAQDIAKNYTRSCALGDAVVLGSGFSKTPYWLARTGAFRRVYGIDSSISAVRAMSRYAKALDHGGRGWDIVRYVRADLTRPGQFRRDASLVLDEGVLDVLQAGPGIDPAARSAARQVMEIYLERASALIRPGGIFVVVGYAGNPAVVNQTTLELSCWTRGGGFLGLDALGADPRRACSPWGPGAYVLTR
ncbi:unnamed protein product [Pelagomonas calceolata]|uniref:Methyltransferase type 11 domain-containing protein n=3 Tax=Pelagomonas calceolata TaxID=35677 RepID=A0A8J2SDR8_9STRA|nr:unnamed protein product [Pelagomonas calceolata]